MTVHVHEPSSQLAQLAQLVITVETTVTAEYTAYSASQLDVPEQRAKEVNNAVFCFKQANNQWSTYAELCVFYNTRFPREVRSNAKTSPDDTQSRLRNNCASWNRFVQRGVKPGHDKMCNRKEHHAVCQNRKGLVRRYRIAPELAAPLQIGESMNDAIPSERRSKQKKKKNVVRERVTVARSSK